MTGPLTQIGNYEIEHEIGQGGMSKVWLAHHRLLENRKVAIKLLIPKDDESIERFKREADITSRLRHEHIIQIYDYGREGAHHYTVMEYVPGGALREWLNTRGPLPLDLALHVFRCAGAALDYAHAHGIIHRDVSPGNILLEQGTRRVLLTDFGIAREYAKAGLTTANLGTRGYLSPEQAASTASVTHLSDVYSMGIVLFEMLSGALPWNHHPGMPDSEGGLFTPPMSLRERGMRKLPAEMDRVIQRMLAIETKDRYPSVKDAIEDLDRVMARHTGLTQIVATANGVAGAAAATRAGAGKRAIATPAPEQHPVEQVLGPRLLKAPMQEAHRHNLELSDEQAIVALLNRWSQQGYFRRKLLGRQAALHRISNATIYFYTLRVLYETREPVKTIEEPDRKAQPAPLEKEQDRWGVELPAPKGFVEDAGGTIRLPGSTRVTACEKCNGIGRTLCPRCQGKQRIPAPTIPPAGKGKGPTVSAAQPRASAAAVAATPANASAKPALIPCPDCAGAGGLPCQHCDGVGRLLQRKTTTWRRRAATLKDNDDLPRIDEQWLQRVCRPVEVYREQHKGDFREEWRLIPALNELIGRARSAADQDSRVILSEVVLEFIPVTEIVFDLGDAPARAPAVPAGKGKTPPAQADADLYCWHIYGFENQLPKDWRFLNWARVTAMALAALLVVAVAVIVLLAVR
jgi:hypothetical protein